ncbi:MAG: four helix bundle protein [Anaerolineae bacterium]|nr:four helix bundle protein [Anaerolineae bacterium]
MSSLPHAGNFRELVVYQKSQGLTREIFEVSKSFPHEERYALTDQVRRSSRSVGAQIAEAWGKRRYENHFISKLTDADAEQYETQHWIDTAVDCGYITSQKASTLNEKCAEVGRLLNGMIAKSHLFCGRSSKSIREPELEYFISTEEAE